MNCCKQAPAVAPAGRLGRRRHALRAGFAAGLVARPGIQWVLGRVSWALDALQRFPPGTVYARNRLFPGFHRKPRSTRFVRLVHLVPPPRHWFDLGQTRAWRRDQVVVSSPATLGRSAPGFHKPQVAGDGLGRQRHLAWHAWFQLARLRQQRGPQQASA